MVTAYITISTELGSEDEIKEAIEKLEGVRECSVVYGVYDLVAVVDADTTEELNDMVFNKIRKFNDVKSTLTLIVVE
ncbi:Lrp/AsnC family transcriptional regulator [Candidatus Bathyarchaeota archaeon]|nr:Lrp/AsnC family transcriptional regulator [Candidatus Bathyarchaeota archaeon]